MSPEAVNNSNKGGGDRSSPVEGSLTTIDTKTTRMLMKSQMKDTLFKHNKFVDDEDLSFSNDPNSICRQLAGVAGIPDYEVESWWGSQKKGVLYDFYNHRNNVIKAVNKTFQCK